MDKLIKKKLIDDVKKEAHYLLGEKTLINRIDKLDDLYVIIKILENYEELEPMIRNFLSEKERQNDENKER